MLLFVTKAFYSISSCSITEMDVQVTPPQGRIEIITGCMFSGKTEELIHRAQRSEIAGEHIVGFKPQIDDRYEKSAICSHTGVNVDAIPVGNGSEGTERVLQSISNHEERVKEDQGSERPEDLIEFEVEKEDIDVIVIDEVNLFEGALVDMVRELAEKDYRIILSGLDLTFRSEPFDPVPNLLALADHVEKRQAVCEECGDPATRTQRLIDGEPAPYDAPTIDVGGKNKYEPRCRNCHKIN